MCGSQRATGGNLAGAERNERNLALSGTLLVSFLLSLGIHSVFLFLPVAQAGRNVEARVTVWQRGASRLQVRLVDQGEMRYPKKANEAEARVAPAAISRRPDDEKKLPVTGFPAVLPDEQPELVSGIDPEIDDPRVRGFMILHLQIDNDGLVNESAVIYSELPQAASDLLVQRFSIARFKPAVKNGQVVESSILLRVDVE